MPCEARALASSVSQLRRKSMCSTLDDHAAASASAAAPLSRMPLNATLSVTSACGSALPCLGSSRYA
jgi:hypothetical protein